jgi:pyruvate dehydrogenase E2 component (dihydrolipoyllysine-residue acetyltransferase)
MSVSVSMPQLGESVTEGTVTRWLKREGEHVDADEPLLEVSTDKVDTEIPSPVSGILRGITVAEDETVAVGAELAVIDEEGAATGAAAGGAGSAAPAAAPEAAAPESPSPEAAAPAAAPPAAIAPAAAGRPDSAAGGGVPGNGAQPAADTGVPAYQPPAYPPPAYREPASGPSPAAPSVPPQAAPPPAPPQQAAPQQAPAAPPQGPPQQAMPAQSGPAAAAPRPPASADTPGGPVPGGPVPDADISPLASGPDGPYVTPLVRKLAAEHGIDLGSVAGTGVGGRIRKQDVVDAAQALRGSAAAAAAPQQPAPAVAAPAPAVAAPAAAAAAPAAAVTAPAAAAAPAGLARPAIVPSTLRGTTEQMSRARQLIAKRMVESLQTSAQLTTVVEADVTAIARLRDLAKADFEAREGVRLSFLPFFALAAVEALKVHPRLNAVIDTASAQVTYHDAEHLGIAVDTDRGLMVPVIRKAGDLNIAGLARKIADLAQRTRAGRVSPDDLSGGTFTLTNTGSRGALFDTPIINQPQVAILGTGTVVKRPVVVEDPALGEVIAVRSMVYLALTYDHRLVDGADAARFLVTVKSRLEEGAFETELGL